MTNQKPTSKRGGHRDGAGRKKTSGRDVPVCLKLSPKAVAYLDRQPNKSAYVDYLIIDDNESGKPPVEFLDNAVII